LGQAVLTVRMATENQSHNERVNLDWLVKRRNEIQETAFVLFDLTSSVENRPLSKKHSLILQDLIGVTFSLWRGVFLAFDKTSDFGKPIKHARLFLKRIVETNNIAFIDDKNSKEWTANYYVDNAGRILQGFPTVDEKIATPRCESLEPKWDFLEYRKFSIQDRWRYNYKILKGKVETLKNHLVP
jgi:hypothetical protein